MDSPTRRELLRCLKHDLFWTKDGPHICAYSGSHVELCLTTLPYALWNPHYRAR